MQIACNQTLYFECGKQTNASVVIGYEKRSRQPILIQFQLAEATLLMLGCCVSHQTVQYTAHMYTMYIDSTTIQWYEEFEILHGAWSWSDYDRLAAVHCSIWLACDLIGMCNNANWLAEAETPIFSDIKYGKHAPIPVTFEWIQVLIWVTYLRLESKLSTFQYEALSRNFTPFTIAQNSKTQSMKHFLKT